MVSRAARSSSFARLLDCTDHAVTGIVDEHVDVAKALERRRHRVSDLFGLRDVETQRKHALGSASD